MIDDDQLAVLHLQTVDTELTHQDVSQLSLCPGVLESEVLHLLSQSPVSNTLVCVMFLIEKLQTDIVYRSRSCHLLFDPRQWEGRCFSCRDLLTDLALNAGGEKPDGDPGLTDLMFHNEPDLQDNDDSVYFPENIIKSEDQTKPDSLTEDTVKPVVIRILKAESVRDNDFDDHDAGQDDDMDGDITADQVPNDPRSEKKNKQKSLLPKPKKRYQNKSVAKERKLQCPGCDFRFSSELSLVKHAKKNHGLSLPMPEHLQKEKCPFCEETFYKKYAPNH